MDRTAPQIFTINRTVYANPDLIRSWLMIVAGFNIVLVSGLIGLFQFNLLPGKTLSLVPVSFIVTFLVAFVFMVSAKKKNILQTLSLYDNKIEMSNEGETIVIVHFDQISGYEKKKKNGLDTLILKLKNGETRQIQEGSDKGYQVFVNAFEGKIQKEELTNN